MDFTQSKEENNMARVLVIGDTHEPFTHPGYLDFCRRVHKEFNCSDVVHVGDEVDNHSISYHEHDPDGKSPGDELSEAKKSMQKWYKAFPKVRVCIGNHSALPFRKLFTVGLSAKFLKNYEEIYDVPKTSNWKWEFSWEIDNVLYKHGTGVSGAFAHRTLAARQRQSTVMGHIHSHGGVAYLASEKDLIFGLNAGCGIDIKSYAMRYGKDFPERPILGCGVVFSKTLAFFVPMDLGSKIIWR